MGFDDSLKRLEAVVNRLEDGRIPLEEALDLYTEGVTLARMCHQALEDAEQRIMTLTVKDLSGRPSSEGGEDPDDELLRIHDDNGEDG
jgi:exodeoxyribonuclease VII small subunit